MWFTDSLDSHGTRSVETCDKVGGPEILCPPNQFELLTELCDDGEGEERCVRRDGVETSHPW